MKIDMSKYIDPGNALGEVSSIDGLNINIYIYPDRFPDISIGEIVVVNSGGILPVVIITSNIHRALSERGFTPLKMDHGDLSRMYPDIDRLYTYVATGVMTGYISRDGLIHIGLGGNPRIHDLVYIMDRDDRYILFHRDGRLDLSPLIYIGGGLGDIVFMREFIKRNMDILLRGSTIDELISTIFNTLLRVGISQHHIGSIISEVSKLFGGRDG